ncbi:MAG TPA: hypothetical protein VFM34_09140 [Moraxellaceae bacterium]|nr:hypothetical protein [Moraxellaceae bacterium]
MKILNVLLASALLSAAVPALAINEGFETGDVTDLAYSLPSGGGVTIVTSFAGNTSTYAPVSGQYFLDLKPSDPGLYTSAFHYHTLKAGETVTGAVAFVSRDALPGNDNAQVLVRSGFSFFGPVVATLFTTDVAATGANTDGPWTPWSFTAPADGNYTVEYRVANSGDATDDSHLLVDAEELDIDIKPGSVLNAIHATGPGLLPVAIVSSPGFDARTIVRSSIRFGGQGTETSGPSFYKDLGGDGDTDLIAVFKTNQAGIGCGARHAFLTARTTSGRVLSGSDHVLVLDSICDF